MFVMIGILLLLSHSGGGIILGLGILLFRFVAIAEKWS